MISGMDQNDKCKKLVHAIQSLEQTEITELFKMLHSNKCEYTKNNNGVFINLSWLSEDMLVKIEKYVAFCNKSRNEVKRYESLCDVLNKNIHEQKTDVKEEDDDTFSFNTETSALRPDKKTYANRISSSMRFYLLKKRFSKQIPITTTLKNDLSREVYAI